MYVLLIIAIAICFIFQARLKQQLLYRIETLESQVRLLEAKLAKKDKQPEKEPEDVVSEPLPATPKDTGPPPVPSKVEEPVITPASETAFGPDKFKKPEPPHEPDHIVAKEPVKAQTKTEPLKPRVKTEPVKAAIKTKTFEPAEPKESELAIKWREFKENVDWELFAGKNLFAWLGGLSLFIAAGFFVKFSIDRNLIPMGMRLAFGGITGIVLILTAQRFRIEKYKVLCHTFVSGGIGVLYSIVYASFLYGYLNQAAGFGMLALVSAAAFVLAVYHKGVSISVLGTVGAYLTPVLVSTGSGNILILFIYLSIVNIGLYQVVRFLKSDLLLLVASAGTCIILALTVFNYFNTLSNLMISSVWSMNLAVFTLFLWFSNKNPDKNAAIKWTGIIIFLSCPIISLLLLGKSGWGSLLAITVAITGAMILGFRNKGWYLKVFPYCAMTFAVALLWAVFNFTPQQPSFSFVIFLLYGVVGGFGPILLIQKYGIQPKILYWFKIFPCAVVGMSLLGFIHGPDVSFWFWPLALALQLIGIFISLLFAAFLQIGILIILLVSGGLYWIFLSPPSVIGMGFFLFLIVAGISACFVIYFGLKKA
ncbi:MAG: DUF2339 domain-containing protein, partial [Desulfobacteraceae bacterium]|nr:DUF2339 domain-containing protein [Desulfobacteraceae bacterium]